MTPLIPSLALTLAAYVTGVRVYRAAGGTPFLHPILVSMAGVLAVLGLCRVAGRPVSEDYIAANGFLIECLMLSVVAFSLPLVDNAQQLYRDMVRVMVCTALCGAMLGATTIAISLALGFGSDLSAAIGLRSVTAPMALAIATANGLSPDTTMLCIFVTGVVGAILAGPALRLMGIEDERHTGLVLGITCHAFGVVRALEISPLAAAYSMIGMILTGLFYSFTYAWALAMMRGLGWL
ncbi:LrgB family protein [Terrihabitans sp. B22-R8]|uniref:LrgB family protein n=1 Tax=Terrihabitans sp. B22-R8 TaxID=3425128 RepID=UPI00403C1CB0